MKRQWIVGIFLCLAVAQMVLIFVLSSQPASVSSNTSASVIVTVAKFFRADFETLSPAAQQQIVSSWQHFVRKMAHFTAYGVLGFFLMGMAHFSRKPSYKLRILLAAATGLFYASSDEFHQRFIPGRSGQLSDVLLDFSGVLFGGLIFTFVLIGWRKHKARRTKKTVSP